MLSDCCLSVLSVCDVGVLWPNGWMDQGETWHGGRPRLWSHCVRWGPSHPPQKGAQQPPNFGPYIYSGQTAGWIKMPLGTKVSLDQSHVHCARWGPSSHQTGNSPTIFGPCLLWLNGRPSQLALRLVL